MEYEDDDVHLKSRVVNFDVIQERIREKEKTKRLLIIVVFLLFVFSAFVFLFAPEGKEMRANIIGVALLVLAMGAIGAHKFMLKLPGVEVKAEGKKEAAINEGTDDSSFLGAEEEVLPIPKDTNNDSEKSDLEDGK